MSEVTEKKSFDIRDTKRILLGWPNKIAYDGNIPEVVAFYSKASGETQRRKSFFESKKLTDIFIYAMCLGKHAGIPADYVKKDGKIDRRATIDVEYFASQPEYVWMMIATALEDTKGNMDIFKDPAKIVEICEKYANYGIHELIEMENDVSGDDPYRGYDKKLSELLDEK
jgi:hypothetical protein